MYSVLVVDDDTMCLLILKACLRKWNYEVVTVKHAREALWILRDKPFDIVIIDVHMPDMDGFELQEHINQEFNLPVIMISADDNPEVISKGVRNGAQCFLVKPISADDVKSIWQYCEWWKQNKKYSTAPVINNRPSCQDNHINAGIAALSAPNTTTIPDIATEKRTKRLLWTANLHNRFVEAIVIIGYHRAVPTNILEVMNVQGLTRLQVASHLQKYQKFLKRLLDGSTDLVSSGWMDFSYYSTYVNGNPNLLLINQLKEERRNGNFAAPVPLRPYTEDNINVQVPAANASLHRPFPPFAQAEASSSRSRNLISMPNNYASSSVNVAAGGLDGATNSYNQNTLPPQQNYYSGNGELVGGANYNNMFPSANNINVAPSTTAPFATNIYSNVGDQGSNFLFNGNNLNYNQQLVPDGSWINNNGVNIPPNNSLLGFDQGDHGEAYQRNMMNINDGKLR